MDSKQSALHSVSVSAAVVREDGSFLAVRRRDNGHWEPPGGVLELDETIEEALLREVREETGVVVSLERLSGVYKNMRRGIVALVFRCSPASGELRPSEETSEVAWLKASDVTERMDEAYAVRLLDALASGPPMVRHHDGTRLQSR